MNPPINTRKEPNVVSLLNRTATVKATGRRGIIVAAHDMGEDPEVMIRFPDRTIQIVKNRDVTLGLDSKEPT